MLLLRLILGTANEYLNISGAIGWSVPFFAEGKNNERFVVFFFFSLFSFLCAPFFFQRFVDVSFWSDARHTKYDLFNRTQLPRWSVQRMNLVKKNPLTAKEEEEKYEKIKCRKIRLSLKSLTMLPLSRLVRIVHFNWEIVLSSSALIKEIQRKSVDY